MLFLKLVPNSGVANVRPCGSLVYQFIWLPLLYSLSIIVHFVHLCTCSYGYCTVSILHFVCNSLSVNNLPKKRQKVKDEFD